MNDQKPLWQRIGPVAATLGVSPDMLEATITAGRMPLRMARFGARQLRFVRSDDVAALLAEAAPAPGAARAATQP